MVNDNERMHQRLKELETMIRSEWPESLIYRLASLEAFDPPRIRVEIDRNHVSGLDKVAVIFRTTEPLMTDIDAHSEKIFSKSIHLATRIFSAPPIDNLIFQGTLILTSSGVSFE